MVTFPTVEKNSDILANLAGVKQRIEAACAANGRSPDEVKLVLVTKTVPPDQIRFAVEAGASIMAENKVQELVSKLAALSDLACERHFIGHLQSNKLKQVVPHVSCIQSLDSLSLAEKLNRKMQQDGRPMKVLLQVNTSGEASKFGVSPDDVIKFVRDVAMFEMLQVRGLMTIGKFNPAQTETRHCFALLRQLRDRTRDEGIPNVVMEHLSMGMSLDLEDAIAEGSTMVRIGRSIFGPRPSLVHVYWNESLRSSDADLT